MPRGCARSEVRERKVGWKEGSRLRKKEAERGGEGSGEAGFAFSGS